MLKVHSFDLRVCVRLMVLLNQIFLMKFIEVIHFVISYLQIVSEDYAL